MDGIEQELKELELQETNARLAEELGLTIEGGEEPQESDSARSKIHAGLLFAIVSAWVGRTALRDIYAAKQRNEKKRVTVPLEKLVQELRRNDTQLTLTKFYLERFCSNSASNPEGKKKIALDGLKGLREMQEKGEEFSVWAVIRALNQAVGRANYGNFRRNVGFAYRADSDHRIIVTPISGEYKWTEPTKIVFSWVQATTEEDYIRPYTLQDIEDPENKGHYVKMRVYKNAGNVVHPSTSTSKEALLENDPLISGLRNLAPGDLITKQYERELSVSEFERQAEQDVNFAMSLAPDYNMKLWPMFKSDEKQVVLYHAGNLYNDAAVM